MSDIMIPIDLNHSTLKKFQLTVTKTITLKLRKRKRNPPYVLISYKSRIRLKSLSKIN